MIETRLSDWRVRPPVASALTRAIVIAGALALTGLTGCLKDTTPPARPLASAGAVANQTSVSGISSGAYMAGQFQLAHGELVVGAAIIAGGPFACAESLFADLIPGPGTQLINMSKAVNGCMLNALQMMGIPSPSGLARRARTLAERGRIAPLEQVRDDRVYLFTGAQDRIVRSSIVRAAAEFYRQIGVTPANIALIEHERAGHAFVTLDKGNACDRSSEPYIVDCDYDQAGALLAHIYGPLQPKGRATDGRFAIFDQQPFTRDMSSHGLASQGLVFLPNSCTAAGAHCRIHIAFHGCGQSRATVGEAFTHGSELADWAVTNRLIVLFPQATTGPSNPQGCWDWWGYTGPDFLTRDAPQIKAVMRMVQRLAAAPGQS